MSGGRPGLVVVVTGTGTEVGKTWVSCSLLEAARARGIRVAARKPVQSYVEDGSPKDADLLAAAAGEQPTEVCPPRRGYPVAMAPPMAAAALGLPVPSVRELAGEIEASWGSGDVQLALVEGAGGVASPLASDGDTASLSREVQADLVVLVADAGLGVINSVRLSEAALSPQPVIVHLNRFDPDDELHRRNADWLTERDGYRVTTTVGALLDQVLSSAEW